MSGLVWAIGEHSELRWPVTDGGPSKPTEMGRPRRHHLLSTSLFPWAAHDIPGPVSTLGAQVGLEGLVSTIRAPQPRQPRGARARGEAPQPGHRLEG